MVEDFTLGDEQFGWMERTLSGSDHPFKFVCIHHAVGGNGGNSLNTLNGRGGARAANVGEQKLVHEAMREFGVQVFFYGHDHVFVDEIVDGNHYALPGSCGVPWKLGREDTGYDWYWGDSGHGRFEVQPDRATVSFVNQGGQVIHEFVVTPGRPMIFDAAMTAREVVKTLVLAASPARVWNAITEPTELVKWLPVTEARIEPRAGAEGALVSELYGAFSVRFDVVEPPTRLVWTWAREPGVPLTETATTTVEWRLEPNEDGGTTLHLREHGFVREEDRQEHDGAWDTMLPELVSFLEGEPRSS